MCIGCWGEYGSPKIDTPAVRAIAPRLRAADPFGGLHIVVEDWNLDASNVRFCRDYPDSTAEERQLATDLLAMPLRHRAAAMALAEGYWA